MTDQDKPKESFLERWSRKKAGAQRSEVDEACRRWRGRAA